jgi:hypothetical protein
MKLSETAETFEPCVTVCEANLKKMLDVSGFCLLSNRNALNQFGETMNWLDDIGFAHTAKYGGCGCLTTVISPEGRLTNPQVVYSNIEVNSAYFREEIDYVRIGPPVESCLVNGVLPIVLGYKDEVSAGTEDRRHTIYQVRKMISADALDELSTVVLEQDIGWFGLNTKFGVFYVGEDRYLAEAEFVSYCLPQDTATDIYIDGRKEIGSEITAKQIRIEECRLQRLYPIDAEQEIALKRLSVGKN